MRGYRICCCFGHRDVLVDISDKLDEVIVCAIEKGCTVFMTGGHGEFDRLFACAVRKAKHKHPQISLELIRPYYSNTWNIHKEYYTALYDVITVPDGLDSLHYKSVITARNRWMADRADVIVAYVYRNFGGAYTAIRYAKGKQTEIINIATDIGI